MNIEIIINGINVQFYQDEELIYETELTAHPIYVLEGFLSALGFNVDIFDLSNEESQENYSEPYYEEDPLDQIED